MTRHKRPISSVPTMNYWLDLFTGSTWDEFRQAGSKLTAFRGIRLPVCQKIRRGDVFLCYLTGVMRWVGALEVVRGPFEDHGSKYLKEFPVRFEVEPLVILDATHGIPMSDLEGKVAFYEKPEHKGGYAGFVRASPNRFQRAEDGALILQLLRAAQASPRFLEVDPKKYARRPLFLAERREGKKTVTAAVSVPEPEESRPAPAEPAQLNGEVVSATRHTEVQFHLLKLGAEMGLDVWVARNDRSKVWKNQQFSAMPRLVQDLPTQFNEATTKTIELIDVLWLKGNSIQAAFEIECTTAVYSGLLRMSDLLTLQPNLDIDLYLVAPDDRRGKVEQEILRPTFALRDRPLPKICGFLPIDALVKKVEGLYALDVIASLKPDFLKKTAEYFGDSEHEDT